MEKGLLGRAFALADSLYFTAGFYFARAMSDSTFLSLNTGAHHSPAFRRLDALWERAKLPLQKTLMNKVSDTLLKSDFSPRPTNDVMKKMAMPLLKAMPQILPKLLAHPSTGFAITAAALIILDPHVRTMIADQTTQVMAMFSAQNGDITQMAARRAPPAATTGVQPSAF